MKKFGKIKRIAASAMVAGISVGIPVAGFMPTSVMAAESNDSDISLKLKQSMGGQVFSNIADVFKTGEVVTLNAVPDEGYRFSSWNLRSNDYMEIVAGGQNESSISFMINDSVSGLFTAEAVFIKDNVHSIQSWGELDQTTAEAGERIDLGKMFSYGSYVDYEGYVSYSSGITVTRTRDGADITSEVIEKGTGILVMPDEDIEISMYKMSSFASGDIVRDTLNSDNDFFTIDNKTDNIAFLPDNAQPGIEVKIVIDRYYSGIIDSVDFRIERVTDGRDVTGDLMNADTGMSFIMPSYDIRVFVDNIDYFSDVFTVHDTDESGEKLYRAGNTIRITHEDGFDETSVRVTDSEGNDLSEDVSLSYDEELDCYEFIMPDRDIWINYYKEKMIPPLVICKVFNESDYAIVDDEVSPGEEVIVETKQPADGARVVATYRIYRYDDGKDVTSEVGNEEGTRFIMPDYPVVLKDNNIYKEKMIPPLVIWKVFNESDYAIVDDEVSPGEEVIVETKQPADGAQRVVATYRIYRYDDGKDVTSEVGNEEGTRFIMPDYPVVLKDNNISFVDKDYSVKDIDRTGDLIYDMFLGFEGGELPGEGGNHSDKETENSASKESDSDKKPGDIIKNDKVLNEKTVKADGVEKNIINNKTVSSVASEKAKTPAVSPVSAAAPSVKTSVPYAVNVQGSGGVSANSVSAPPTGDYNITSAITVAALAAGVGIAAAAIVLKKRMSE